MKPRVPLFATTIFVSAFLLFTLEFVVAKLLLPVYGGSYMVWGGCVVFFQAALLAGYGLAHIAVTRIGLRRYWPAHLALLVLPLALFPGRILSVGQSAPGLPIMLDVFLKLTVTIGPAFVLLAATGILLQSLAASLPDGRRENPYRLYAASNLGSFAALASYPFIWEVLCGLTRQQELWRWGYVLLILLCGTILVIYHRNILPGPAKPQRPWASRRVLAGILMLSAASVMLFLAVTSLMTTTVAPIPLLWMVPLAIYLLSFVLNYKDRPWCPDWIETSLPTTLALAAGGCLLLYKGWLPILVNLAWLSALLFLLCMAFHRALFRLRPMDSAHLSRYYLIIAAGSFLGGLVTTWAIPLIAQRYMEFPLGLALGVAGIAVGQRAGRPTKSQGLALALGVILIWVWPPAFLHYSVLGVIALVAGLIILFRELRGTLILLAVFLAVFALAADRFDETWLDRTTVAVQRNYYGILRVVDHPRDGLRLLEHGTTLHGAQFLDPAQEREPLTYYHRSSPVGDVLDVRGLPRQRVALIGLGAGTLASYAQPGQQYDFFEIDPDMARIAATYFTYLRQSRGDVRIILGDGRQQLARQNGRYDLIIVDAFTSDAIPFHLMTTEALSLYRDHLTPTGIILFHTSNRFFSLKEPVATAARSLKASVSWKSSPQSSRALSPSQWMAITWSKATDILLTRTLGFLPDISLPLKKTAVFSDDFSPFAPHLMLKDMLRDLGRYRLLYW